MVGLEDDLPALALVANDHRSQADAIAGMPARLSNGSIPSRYSSTALERLDVAELRVDVEEVPLDDARNAVAHGLAHDDRPESLGDRVLDRCGGRSRPSSRP